MGEFVNPRLRSDSVVEMTELILPNDTNLLGNLIGGKLMYWIDLAAGMSALRYSNGSAATVSLEHMDFRHPIHLGSIVRLKAVVYWTGHTSMKIRVNVTAEDFTTGVRIDTNSAELTFVALDANNHPRPVPPLKRLNEEEEAEFMAAEMEYHLRKQVKI